MVLLEDGKQWLHRLDVWSPQFLLILIYCSTVNESYRGNLGGAWTQVFMGTILFPAFERYFGDSEKSWRVICVIPASMAFVWGLILPWISDDAPMGNYKEMKKNGSMDRIFFTTALRSGATKNTW